MQPAIDREARWQIDQLRARIAELEGRAVAPAALPPGERFARVLAVVSDDFGVTPAMIVGHLRHADTVAARHAAMALAQRVLGYSLPRIGRLIHRDHTTVLHGIRKVAAACRADPDFAARMDRLAERIRKGDPK